MEGNFCYYARMLKYFVALLILIAALIGGFFAFNNYIYDQKQGGAEDYKNATFMIDGVSVGLGAEGTAYFGNEAKGDLNDDGIPDVAFILTQNGGGSGTFFYTVAAFQNAAGRYIGTNGILLGDRIAPQSTEIRNGILIVNYADRKPDEPMAATPSIGVSTYIYFDGTQLVAVPPVGPITIRGKMVCLPHRLPAQAGDTEGPQTLECAFGLQDDSGRYFALSDTDPEYKNVSGVPMSERVEVEGNFKLQLGSKYQGVGIIEVSRIQKL